MAARQRSRDSSPIKVARDGALLEVVLDRPEKLNAINPAIIESLAQAVRQFRDTTALKVMLIRATGRFFSAGADLLAHDFRYPPTGTGVRLWHRVGLAGMQALWDEIETVEKVVVVAHHAPCFGAGLEMSLSCDFRLAARSARYCLPEASFGTLPALGGVSRLTRIVGPHWARYLIMTSLEIDAHKALEIGLLHEVYSDESFYEDVKAFCRRLLAQPPEVLGMAKTIIDLTAGAGAAEGRMLERLGNSGLMLGEEYCSLFKEKQNSLDASKGGDRRKDASGSTRARIARTKPRQAAGSRRRPT